MSTEIQDTRYKIQDTRYSRLRITLRSYLLAQHPPDRFQLRFAQMAAGALWYGVRMRIPAWLVPAFFVAAAENQIPVLPAVTVAGGLGGAVDVADTGFQGLLPHLRLKLPVLAIRQLDPTKFSIGSLLSRYTGVSRGGAGFCFCSCS